VTFVALFSESLPVIYTENCHASRIPSRLGRGENLQGS
jgi:hypothetical protein